MKIGFVGLGKFGMPVAEVVATKHDVVGFDIAEVSSDTVSMVSTLEEAVRDRDIVFVAVETPHSPEYGGEKPTGHLSTKDFDYSTVQSVLSEINQFANKDQLVALISTVLPGTTRKHLEPCLTNARFIYNPYLIAMNTVKSDFVNPEMVIIGTRKGDVDGDAKELIDFYETLMQSDTRYEVGTWDEAEAEAIKIFYNTFISAKRLALKALDESDRVVLVGKAYKPGVNLTSGSYSLLVGHYVELFGGKVTYYDPNTDDSDWPASSGQVYLIGYIDRWVKDLPEDIQKTLEPEAETGELFPHEIALCYDFSCNLACPSGRTEKKLEIRGENFERTAEYTDQFVQTLRDNPCDHETVLRVTGSGDPFAAPNYLRLLESLDYEELPNVKIVLQTNAVLMTPKNWERIKGVHRNVKVVSVSIDAAIKETYEVVRKLSNWDKLMENLKFISQLKALNPLELFCLNFVVQKQNFHEIPDFVRLAQSIVNVDEVFFSFVNDWGTWSPEEYKEQCAWKVDHPDFPGLMQALRDPVLEDPIVKLGNLSEYRRMALESYDHGRVPQQHQGIDQPTW